MRAKGAVLSNLVGCLHNVKTLSDLGIHGAIALDSFMYSTIVHTLRVQQFI